MLPHAEVNWEERRQRLEAAGFSESQTRVLCAIIANTSVSPAVLNCTLGSLTTKLQETVEANFLANRDEVREFRREMTALEGGQSERFQDRFNCFEARFDSLSSSSSSLKEEVDVWVDAAHEKQRADHLAERNVSRWRVITLSVSITGLALPALWSVIRFIPWRSIFP